MKQYHTLENTELVEMYKKAGFFDDSGFGERPALLVIDMAKNWTDPSEMMGTDLSGPMAAIKKLLAVCREKNVPRYFTTMGFDPNVYQAGGGVIKGEKQANAMVRGSNRLELDPDLGRLENEPLIEKPRGSAFFGTNLLSMLINQQIDTLIVTGCSTSGCIRQTVTDGANWSFHVIIPEEAVGDRSWSAHEANLFDMDARYADVVGLDEVLEYINGLPASR